MEVREDDGAIQARIAIVLEGFAPVLDAGDQASRPRWQREHFVVADFEVREKERRFVVAPHLDQGALQIAVHPAAEWVVRGWSRIRQCLHHEIVGDAIAGDVAALGLGVEHRALPEPFASAAQPLQQPIGTAGHVHDARNLGEAVVVDFDFQAFVRHALGQVRQAVGRTDWAEGVVVVLRRHAQLHRRERRRRMAPGVVVRVVVHHLREALDGVAGGVENMAEVAEHGVARELAGDVAVRVEVVALGALAVDGAADVFVQVPLAARVADGKHLELARAIGIDVAQAGAGGVGDQVELAVEGMGAVVAEIGVSLPRASFGDAIAEVRVGPARVLLRVHAVAGEERAVDAEAGAALVEGGSPGRVQVRRRAVDVFVQAVAGAQAEALEIRFEDVVHHPGHGVGAVDGRGAVLEDFQPVEAERRHHVGVGAVHRHEAAAHLFGLEAGGIHHAPPVQQHQRVAGADVAQVVGADVAARRVHAAADVVRLVEEVLPLLRQHVQQFLAGVDAEQLDFIRAQHGNRQQAAHVHAANVGAGDDDDLVAFEAHRDFDGRLRRRFLGAGFRRLLSRRWPSNAHARKRSRRQHPAAPRTLSFHVCLSIGRVVETLWPRTVQIAGLVVHDGERKSAAETSRLRQAVAAGRASRVES